MADEQQFTQIGDWLRERGHTEDEISRILQRVREYESRTQNDSLMESIGAGSFDLDAIVKEVLGDDN